MKYNEKKSRYTIDKIQVEKHMVVIVIPVYKPQLSMVEKASLMQVNRILGHYPRVFLAPESLQFDYGELGRGYGIERFPDQHFINVDSYSRLMLSESFYRRFVDYRYLLLYQLDAFVFSDCLQTFCKMDFDYIGAPVFRFTPHWHAIRCSVGNGGFSLRKISSAIRMLQEKEKWSANHPFKDIFEKWEDVFWGFCGTESSLNFKVPSVELALRFSIQDDVAHAFRRIGHGLPFGCHGWYKANFSFWRPIIERQGYNLSMVTSYPTGSYREWFIQEYLSSRGKINLRILYSAFWQEAFKGALDILLDWLLRYDEISTAWQNKTEEFICLWRICRQESLKRKNNILLVFLEQAIIEAMRRTLTAGNFRWWQVEMINDLLPNISCDFYNSRERLGKQVQELLSMKGNIEQNQHNWEVENNLISLLHGIETTKDVTVLCKKLWEICEDEKIAAGKLLTLLKKSVANPEKVLNILSQEARKI